ncbi:MAG: FliO/MopB family protein [Bryobacteraceae bacterium]
MSQLSAVSGVLLLAAACAWWLRRRGVALPARGRRRLEAVERLPLAAQHALVLVRVNGRMMLIGLSPGGCTVLESFEAPEAPPC